jgi:poly-gamma-glutamate synthesis protein (capsule biosynthesis protein)
VGAASALALKRAGFHALSLGNNHILDYGVSGLRETITTLGTNNIATFGAGGSEGAARSGLVCDFGTLRIGLLGYGEEASETKALAKGKRGGYALLSEENLAQDIAAMRKRADVVVVSLHWGKNYKDVTASQQKMGRHAVESGADIVYGHHPHIAQGIEIHRGKPIIYSLGNFVFGSKGRYPDGKQGYGLVSRWIFEGKTLKWVMTTPIGINNEIVNFQPRRVPAEEARQALEPHLKRYGTLARWEADTAFIGFGSEWRSAALPKIPWKEKGDATATASRVENVPATVRQ